MGSSCEVHVAEFCEDDRFVEANAQVSEQFERMLVTIGGFCVVTKLSMGVGCSAPGQGRPAAISDCPGARSAPADKWG